MKQTEQAKKITKVAASLFAQKGYNGVGVAEIGAASGFGRGTLYHHIESKEDLLHVHPRASALRRTAMGLRHVIPDVRGSFHAQRGREAAQGTEASTASRDPVSAWAIELAFPSAPQLGHKRCGRDHRE